MSRYCPSQGGSCSYKSGAQIYPAIEVDWRGCVFPIRSNATIYHAVDQLGCFTSMPSDTTDRPSDFNRYRTYGVRPKQSHLVKNRSQPRSSDGELVAILP